jgi:hypothetical protein
VEHPMKSPKWLAIHAVGPGDMVGSQLSEGVWHGFLVRLTAGFE